MSGRARRPDGLLRAADAGERGPGRAAAPGLVRIGSLRRARRPLSGLLRLMDAAMKTRVILVNRNNKTDTVECLESLRRCEGDFDVFVADNGSTDGSLEAIAAWAEGRLPVDTSTPAWDSIR